MDLISLGTASPACGGGCLPLVQLPGRWGEAACRQKRAGGPPLGRAVFRPRLQRAVPHAERGRHRGGSSEPDRTARLRGSKTQRSNCIGKEKRKEPVGKHELERNILLENHRKTRNRWVVWIAPTVPPKAQYRSNGLTTSTEAT